MAAFCGVLLCECRQTAFQIRIVAADLHQFVYLTQNRLCSEILGESNSHNMEEGRLQFLQTALG